MDNKNNNSVNIITEKEIIGFYVPIDFGDSLNFLWENDVHGSFNNSSFVFFDSTIFVHDLSGRIHSFNIFTGKQTGVLKYKGANFSTPIIFNSTIVMALVLNNENKTELIYYNFIDGEELKIVEVDGRVINQMIKINDELLLVTEEGLLKKYDSKGSEVWRTNINSFVHCNPSYSNGNVYFGNDEGEFICIDIATSNTIYKKRIGKTFNSGIHIKNKFAYLGDDYGTLFKVRIEDGELEWQYDTGSKITMTPVLDNTNIFVGNLSGKLFSISQNNGDLNWVEKFNGAVFSASPIITNNMIIIPDLFKSVMIIDKVNGLVKNKIDLDARAKMTPAIRNNILFIGFDDGIVRAYEIIN